MKRLISVLLVVFSSAIFVSNLQAQTAPAQPAQKRFVSTTGNDTAAGTSDAPWQTLQHAATVANPGDIINVLPGSYAGMDMSRSGVPGARITFLAQPGVIVNKPCPIGSGDAINLEGASYVTIDGFTCVGSQRAGVRSVTNKCAIIRNCICQANYMWGIFTSYSDNVVIEHNKTSGSLVEHGIYVSHATQSPVIRYNESFGNNVNGIHLNSGVNQSVIGALVEHNVLYENGKNGGSAINCDGILDSTIQDNLAYNNHFMGISLYRDTSTLSATGNRVLRNVVIMSPISGSMYALNIRKASTCNEVRDNVFSSMLLDADCIPGYQASGNIVSLPVGATMYISADSDKTHLTAAQWGTATGETDLRVSSPDQVFESLPGFYRRKGQ